MTCGFITLATGKKQYYKAAVRLLQSYRLHNGKCRFCIVCDKENKYTKYFDDVILLDNCNFDYRDKFQLLNIAPYDKNIFIEPDCLIYNNIDSFWDMFKNATPFSAFGYNEGSIGFWFESQDLIKEKFGINCIPIFNPGYLYIEKGELCKKIHRDALRISQNIISSDEFKNESKIFHNTNLRDDPILCLAMEINKCKCAAAQTEGKCMSLPSVIKFNALSMAKGMLDVTYNLNGETVNIKNCNLLHFSSRRLSEWLYIQQSLSTALLSSKCLSFLAPVVEHRLFGTALKKLLKLVSELKALFK